MVSHFHGDHISGLWVKETDAQVFPNAEMLMPEVEFKFWTDPALVEKLPETNRPMGNGSRRTSRPGRTSSSTMMAPISHPA